MSPESRFEHVKLEGRNVGASMIARHGGCSGESHECCCINIYISNNIQGVNNSILVGSKVKLGDPGVSFSMKDVKFHRGFRQGKRGAKKIKGTHLQFFSMLLVAFVAVLFLMSCLAM
ncbi:hypothetical protein RND71_014031 [Anisodus tanguticus]|uniref:Uncharacterized protein n=1 Tax=Anisodus tanguticus TaxID=243964 RepID=A0AAE1SAI7_9SOLA|nr:hypothetical protein RND71_014031 [Anisodus tanguticus]